MPLKPVSAVELPDKFGSIQEIPGLQASLEEQGGICTLLPTSLSGPPSKLKDLWSDAQAFR